MKKVDNIFLVKFFFLTLVNCFEHTNFLVPYKTKININ